MILPASHPLLQRVYRWTSPRKVAIVDAITSGQVGREQITRVHGISSQRLEGWIVKRIECGPEALRATSLQHYLEVRT